MNREHILTVLYDLSLTIGGEIHSDALLTRTLQRLLYHTAFPAGVVIEHEGQALPRLVASIGNHRLGAMLGSGLQVSRPLLGGTVALLEDAALLATFSLGHRYTHALRLPVGNDLTILLLTPEMPVQTLPLEHVFQPVLANLAKSILLCRSNERTTQALESDRDEARSLLQSLYRAIPDLVWLKDPNGAYLSCNPTFCRFFGAPEEAIVGKRDHDFVDPALADFFLENDRAAIAAGKPSINEEWLTFADDGYHGLFETIKTPMYGRDGHLIGVLGVARDISEHRREIDETIEHLRQTQFAMDRVGIAIHWVDAHTGRLRYVNEAACTLLGYTRDELLAMSVPDIDPNFPADKLEATFASLREKHFGNFESHNRRKDGSLVPVDVAIYFQRGGGDGNDVFIVFLSDITARKAAERALIEARNAAEEATRAKSAFLANMSHEIRTPMNAVLGIAHLMRRSGLTDAQAQQVDKIDTAAHHLLAIINDILDLSKIEAGKMTLEEVPLAINALPGNVVSMIAERAREKGLNVTVETDMLPPNLVGDPTRLQQSLLNLATNAVKFTDRGNITLRTRKLAEDEASVLLRFEVQDTGIGIEAEAIARLFNAFQQADNSTTRQYGGTGLGLTITRSLAQLMGGDAGVDSTPGAGSRFWFTARLRKQTLQPAAASGNIRHSAEDMLQRDHLGARILLVEDDEVNQEIAAMLLTDVGLAVDIANNGVEAVDMAKQGDYALILMDMQMPVLDGLGATERIRRTPGLHDTPIVAMTANAFAEDKAKCLAAGMNDFVTKPVDPAVLFAKLVEWLPQV